MRANTRSTRALAALRQALAATDTCSPGTSLPLVYETTVMQA